MNTSHPSIRPAGARHANPIAATDFDTGFNFLIGIEGGFTNDPKDRGNWTGGAIGAGKLRDRP